MGNCCERCFGKIDKRRYLRTRYNVERDISIEFENLMDEETTESEMSKGQLEFNRPFTVSSYMRWLVHQEEELRREEEAYSQARREVPRLVKALRQKDPSLKPVSSSTNKDQNKWLGDDDSDWEMAGSVVDFDVFLECVKARSLAAQSQVTGSQVAGDAASEDERSKTEASSIDLEWEHEAGMQPIAKEKRKCYQENNMAELAIKPMLLPDKPDSVSDDFEWDNDFDASPNQVECRTLLAKSSPAHNDGTA